MSETIPLFPLGTVLYPGLLLPLHIFEDRYRQLVGDLLEGPEPRRFGVIAIRKGRGPASTACPRCTRWAARRCCAGWSGTRTAGTTSRPLRAVPAGGLGESRPYLQAGWTCRRDRDEAAAGLGRGPRRAFRGYLEAGAWRPMPGL
jgi:hypothetical protein